MRAKNTSIQLAHASEKQNKTDARSNFELTLTCSPEWVHLLEMNHRRSRFTIGKIIAVLAEPQLGAKTKELCGSTGHRCDPLEGQVWRPETARLCTLEDGNLYPSGAMCAHIRLSNTRCRRDRTQPFCVRRFYQPYP